MRHFYNGYKNLIELPKLVWLLVLYSSHDMTNPQPKYRESSIPINVTKYDDFL